MNGKFLHEIIFDRTKRELLADRGLDFYARMSDMWELLD